MKMGENIVMNVQQNVQEEDNENEEETLSLSDLPFIHNSRKGTINPPEQEENNPRSETSSPPLEDFDFCSFSKESSEMCTADEVFYQGQILPLRNSISSEKGTTIHQYSSSSSNTSRSISSRSSSINSTSQQSSSSSAAAPEKYRRKPPHNHFHSLPSPSPKVHTQPRNSTNKSTPVVWNILRLGLVTAPPEIAFQNVSSNCKNLRSRTVEKINNSEKKKSTATFFGGCKCSLDAVDTVTTKVEVLKKIHVESSPQVVKQQAPVKKRLSHYRTFEWLKQLSVEGTSEEA